MKKTKILGGKKFKHQSCSTSKRRASEEAKRLREKGFTARVIKTDGKHCVYRGPKRKKS